MKKSYFVLFLLNLFYCVSVFGQSTTIVDTKDLVSMSRRVGLDSVLRLVRGIPISVIDSISCYNLVKEVGNSEPSERLSVFFTQYIMKHYDEAFKDDVFEYFSKEKELIKNYKTFSYGGIPIMNDDVILSIVRYSDSRTEGLLCDYYKEWITKSKEYIEDYKQGEKEMLGMKEMYQQPLKDCHMNCFKFLKALDLIKSTFPDSIKYKSHSKFLPSSWLRHKFSPSSERDDSQYTRYRFPVDTIYLSKSFKVIGDVDLKNNPKFKEFIKEYRDPDSWCLLISNKRVAYLNIGSGNSYMGHDRLCWLELIDDVIIIHEIYESEWTV